MELTGVTVVVCFMVVPSLGGLLEKLLVDGVADGSCHRDGDAVAELLVGVGLDRMRLERVGEALQAGTLTRCEGTGAYSTLIPPPIPIQTRPVSPGETRYPAHSKPYHPFQSKVGHSFQSKPATRAG
jgi:hypothetical protein